MIPPEKSFVPVQLLLDASREAAEQIPTSWTTVEVAKPAQCPAVGLPVTASAGFPTNVGFTLKEFAPVNAFADESRGTPTSDAVMLEPDAVNVTFVDDMKLGLFTWTELTNVGVPPPLVAEPTRISPNVNGEARPPPEMTTSTSRPTVA